jgi:hypothetical protein
MLEKLWFIYNVFLPLFFIIIFIGLFSPAAKAQWDSWVFADGKLIKARIFIGTANQLPRFFASVHFCMNAELFYIASRIGTLSASSGKYIGERGVWHQGMGCFYL